MSAVFTGANAAYNHRSLQHKASDFYTAMRIKHNIGDLAESSQSNINVTSFNHIVLLTGQTPSPALRNQAADIAKNTPDVIRVFNAISIGQSTSAAQNSEDTWITTKIKSKFIASNDIEPNKIKVVTENDVVYLMGIVPKDEADAAVDIAKNTDGVQRVVSIFYYVVMPKLD